MLLGDAAFLLDSHHKARGVESWGEAPAKLWMIMVDDG